MTSRLDAALAARGLARSRSHAAALIAAGAVRIDGEVVSKASHRVTEDVEVTVTADPYVSRGAHKLIAALAAFGIAVSGRTALDLGASTGGFTQVLRERGAELVIAADVGHGQLAPEIASDQGVRVVEGFNVRYMTRESLAAVSGVAHAPEIVTGDLSFISLTQVLPAISAVVDGDGDVVLLVKPQFEVGRTGVREGIVVDPELRARAVRAVLAAAWDEGLGTLGVLRSPLVGGAGNREVLVHLAPHRGAHPTEWDDHVAIAAGG